MPGGKPAVLTFLLTDIEGSTRLWAQYEDLMDGVIARHDELIALAVSTQGGEFLRGKGEGDSTFSVFASPRDALAAAVDVQLALAREPWPAAIELRTRAALHSGEAKHRDGDYFGSTVNRCARLRAVAHGGQIVLSQATTDLVVDELPDKVTLRDLGAHGLRDFSRPERIAQADHPELDGEFPPLQSLGTRRTNLPAQRSSFVGRTQELATVAGHLTNHRLVTLTGVGGCGKTRLAVEVAAREIDKFEGTFFCDLAVVADPEVVVVEVAKSVGVLGGGPLMPSPRGVKELLLDHLAARRVLVVLDNCEHLVEAAARLVDDLLDACPAVTILATSREALEIDGERAYTVPSLPLSADGDADSDAAHLFVDRASAVDADFVLTAENARHVVEICQRLDGIPLAIELAAAQASTLTPQQIEERLSDRFRLLSGGRRRVQRQQTLAAMLEWSHDLLDDAERALLRRLSVFPQPFTLEQAEGVGGATGTEPVAATLRALRAKSLLVPNADRYRLLETVRLYAEQKLVEAGEADEYRTRHCGFFRRWLESFDPDDEVWTPQAAAVFIPEVDHLRAAMRWADENDDPATIAAIISRSWLGNPSSFDEVAGWFARAMDAQDLPDEDRRRLLTARAWAAIGRLDLQTMMGAATETLSLPADDSGLCHGLAHAFLALALGSAHYLFEAGDAETVRQHAAQAMASARSDYARVMASVWVALAQTGLRDLEGARTTLRTAAAIDWRADAAFGALHTILALVEHLLGDDDAAIATMERSVAIFAADAWSLATEYDRFWTAPYGPVVCAVGREDEGVAFMEDLTAHLDGTALPPQQVNTVLGCLGSMCAMTGRYDEAVQLMVQGLENPMSALDHMVLLRYMDEAKANLSETRFTQLCAAGRTLTLADGSALGLAALRNG